MITFIYGEFHHNVFILHNAYILYGEIWFKMVNMTKTIIQIKDATQRRVVIPKEVWDIEGLQKDDYIEIDIKKIEKPKQEPTA